MDALSVDKNGELPCLRGVAELMVNLKRLGQAHPATGFVSPLTAQTPAYCQWQIAGNEVSGRAGLQGGRATELLARPALQPLLPERWARGGGADINMVNTQYPGLRQIPLWPETDFGWLRELERQAEAVLLSELSAAIADADDWDAADNWYNFFQSKD